MSNKIVNIKLGERVCDCCGSDDLETVWSNQSDVVKASAIYRFDHNVVICRVCGFCFNSPCYKREDLLNYYADGLSGCKNIGLPYSIKKRLDFITTYRVSKGTFVEISGDRPEEFHAQCSSLFDKVLNVEMSNGDGFKKIEDIPSCSVDVLAHYDVLEHISEPIDFLKECWRTLKQNGVMICEVPDVRLYPRNILLSEFEHVNHFSVSTLAALALKSGLALVEVSHMASRNFGFAAAFRKRSLLPEMVCATSNEYYDTRACVLGGIKQINGILDQINLLRGKINRLASSGAKITLWGVTDLLRMLLQNFHLPQGVLIVDMDPRRESHLEMYGTTVFEPKNKKEHINDSQLLAIFAPRYKDGIINWISTEIGKSFKSNELYTVGSGDNGESLS